MVELATVDRWRRSQWSCARFSLAWLRELRRHESCCCSAGRAIRVLVLHSLAEHGKDQIYSIELLAGLDGLIDLAIRVDDRIDLHSQHREGWFPCERVTGTEALTTCDMRSQRLDLPEADHVADARLVAGQRLSRKEEQMVSVTTTQLPSGGRPVFQALLWLWVAVFRSLR